jgi:hypothetical protein
MLILMSTISFESGAQQESESCPCFNHEEVESIFLQGLNLSEEQGMIDCSAEDYSVEFSAEVIVWDQDYAMIAQVRVEWFDFDPGGCEYIETSGDVEVERNTRWPHPAPQETAHACFNIISTVISNLDKLYNCTTYP